MYLYACVASTPKKKVSHEEKDNDMDISTDEKKPDAVSSKLAAYSDIRSATKCILGYMQVANKSISFSTKTEGKTAEV